MPPRGVRDETYGGVLTVQVGGADDSRKMLHAVGRWLAVARLNPKLFMRKCICRFRLATARTPAGLVTIRIGLHSIETLPSRSDWWKSMYLGCCAIEIVECMKQNLKPGGVFVDVGAAVGYLSAMAAQLVGSTGQVHCFEPLPANANSLRAMVARNPLSNIVVNDCALGVDDGTQPLFVHRTARGTAVSMIPGVLSKATEVVHVETQRLDSYLRSHGLDIVSLIKIDVEGYEYHVLAGLAGFLEETSQKPPIICEVFTPAYGASTFTLADLQQLMEQQGYRAYNILDPRVPLQLTALRDTTDVLFRPVALTVR